MQQPILGLSFELMVWSKKLRASDDLDGGLNLTIRPVEKPRER